MKFNFEDYLKTRVSVKTYGSLQEDGPFGGSTNKTQAELERLYNSYIRNGIELRKLHAAHIETGEDGIVHHVDNPHQIMYNQEVMTGFSFGPKGKLYGHFPKAGQISMSKIQKVVAPNNKGIDHQNRVNAAFADVGIASINESDTGYGNDIDVNASGKKVGSRIGTPVDAGGENPGDTFFLTGESRTGPPERMDVGGEVKLQPDGIAMGSMMLHHNKERGWHITEENKKLHPVLTSAIMNSKIPHHITGKEISLIEHVNNIFTLNPKEFNGIYKSLGEKRKQKNFEGAQSVPENDASRIAENYTKKGCSFMTVGSRIYSFGRGNTPSSRAFHDALMTTHRQLGLEHSDFNNIGRTMIKFRYRPNSAGNVQAQFALASSINEKGGNYFDIFNETHMAALSRNLKTYGGSPHHQRQLENSAKTQVTGQVRGQVQDGTLYNFVSFLTEKNKLLKRGGHDPTKISSDIHKRAETAFAILKLHRHAKHNATKAGHNANRERVRNHIRTILHDIFKQKPRSQFNVNRRSGIHRATHILRTAEHRGHTIRGAHHDETQVNIQLTNSFDMLSHNKTLRQILSEIYTVNEEVESLEARDDIEAEDLHRSTETTPFEKNTEMQNIILRHKMIAADKILSEHEATEESQILGKEESLDVRRTNTDTELHKIARSFHTIEHMHRHPEGEDAPKFETLSEEDQNRHMHTAAQSFSIIISRPKA